MKCFNQKKYEELLSCGYKFLYEQNGVYYFENNEHLTRKFSGEDVLEGTKTSTYIGL